MKVPKDPRGEEGGVDCSKLNNTSLSQGDHSASSEARRTVLR